MVCQENATVVHHMSDTAHGQRLLKKVVVDKHIGGYHEIESLSFGNVHGLRHHIHVEPTDLRGVSWPDGHPAHRYVDYRRWNRKRLHRRAQHLAKLLPVRPCFPAPLPRTQPRQPSPCPLPPPPTFPNPP